MASIHVPGHVDIDVAAEAARGAGLRIFIDGQRTILAHEKPQGQWAEFKLRVVSPRRARLQVIA